MDLNKCKELIEKNYSYTDIAKEFNIPLTTLKRKLKQAGLKTKHNPVTRVNLKIEEVEKLVNENCSTYEIAEKLNTSQTNVRHWLKKWKLKTIPQKKHHFSNNKNNYKNQKTRSIQRKIFFIKQLGGKCKICGYNKNLASLTFHHKNSDEKSFQLDSRHLSNNSLEILQTEVNKCDLLCHNCHHELHHPHLELSKLVGLVGFEPTTKRL